MTGSKGISHSTQYGTKSFNLDVAERNACLQALIDGESPDPTDQPPSVLNLIQRFADIEDIFPDELCEEALPYFLDWLTENVMLVEITAFSDDDAYTIFETMNDRGLSLTPTDMLKGYLLANITDDESRGQAGDAWKAQMTKLRDLGKDEDARTAIIRRETPAAFGIRRQDQWSVKADDAKPERLR